MNESQILEVAEAEEAELQKHYNNCKKNPGHAGFIKFTDFHTDCLPAEYQDAIVFQLVMILSAITVRIHVGYTSDKRPKNYPESVEPYDHFEDIGKPRSRTGTGSVIRVAKVTGSRRNSCPCAKCRGSVTPSRTWYQMSISTATHLVFDDSEARAVACRLFYDEQDSEVITLDGLRMEDTDVTRDESTLLCVTCDSGIFERLSNHLRELHQVAREALKRYPSSDLNIIVSHPHGCPKHISLGRWTQRNWTTTQSYARYPFRKFIYCRYYYNTATCPGSSGSQVYNLGSIKLHTHVHRGSEDGINYSSNGIELLTAK